MRLFDTPWTLAEATKSLSLKVKNSALTSLQSPAQPHAGGAATPGKDWHARGPRHQQVTSPISGFPIAVGPDPGTRLVGQGCAPLLSSPLLSSLQTIASMSTADRKSPSGGCGLSLPLQVLLAFTLLASLLYGIPILFGAWWLVPALLAAIPLGVVFVRMAQGKR